MLIDCNVNLEKYNTMRLKSIGKTMYTPENVEELSELIIDFKKRKFDYLILSGGSNIIMNKIIDRPIINMRKVDETLNYNKNSDIVECGCSVSLQKLIVFLKKNNLGGIEYLYSVPGLVGGAIYMNAGRGKIYNQNISDYIQYIDYFDGCKFNRISKDDAKFNYRYSVFKERDWLITKVFFKFPSQDSKITDSKIKERLTFSNNYLDTSLPSCGSIFKKGSQKIFSLLRGLKLGKAKFSNKTNNWISNSGNAKYYQVMILIYIAIIIHKILLKNVEREVIVWKN